MKIYAPKSRLHQLPRRVQLALFLIAEELKSRKLFLVLSKVGLDYSFYQPHLDTAILSCIGLDHNSHEVFDSYDVLLDKYADKVKDDPKSLMKQALKVYGELDRGEKVASKGKDDDFDEFDDDFDDL